MVPFLMKPFLFLALVAFLACGCERKNVPSPQSEEQCANCAARLRQLDHAKILWAEMANKTTNDTPTMDDLSPYLRGIPSCPSGGTYTMTHVGELSTCSIPEHNAYYQKSLITTN